ncbi:MAG: ABC transporter permease [Candidatus Heimdallarchaeota archaeon]|nr:ABC transporter permease [Candidatus Heimdallarchaeota archaeon]
MKVLRLAKLVKTQFTVYTRVKQSFFFSILFPLVFIAVFGIAFQESDPANTTIQLGLISNDQGIPNGISLDGTEIDQAYDEQFIELLSTITFKDNITKIFEISRYLADEYELASLAVEKRSIKGLVILEEDFSLAVLSSYRRTYEPIYPENDWSAYPVSNYTTDVKLEGDPNLVSFSIITSVMEQVVQRYFDQSSSIVNAILSVNQAIETDGLTTFDMIVPGLIIFAIINNLGTTASVALRDVQLGQLKRLKLTRMKPSEYIVSLILSQSLMAMIQIPIMMLASMMFGFRLTLQMFTAAYLLSFIVSFAITGMGVFLAGFVRDSSSAGGLAAIIGTPMAFLAGAFFTMPNPVLIPAGGVLGDNSFRVFDFLPPTRAITGMRLILSGYGLADIKYEFMVSIFLAILYLGLGIYFYSRKHLRPD